MPRELLRRSPATSVSSKEPQSRRRDELKPAADRSEPVERRAVRERLRADN